MKKLFLATGLLSLMFIIGTPSKASAAIAFDNATGITIGSGSSQTIPYTVSGSNTFLVVSTETGYPGTDDVTSITYNGVAMTRLFTSLRTRQDFIYYLVNPSTGTHDVVISLNRSADSITTTITSYTGVNQIGQPTQSNSCASATCSVTTTTNNAWLVGTGFADSSWTNPTGQTERTSISSQKNIDKGPITPTGTDSLAMVGATGQLLVFVMAIEPVSIPIIVGSGTINRLAKFITASSIGDSLFSDDGSNTTLTSGNLFLQIGSLIDSVTNGVLNFGTTQATTMNFGRSGQNMIINSKVGIGTSAPTAVLHVNGDFFADVINIAANGLGLDTLTPGTLSIGSTTASTVKIGRAGVTTTVPGTISFGTVSTLSNCNSTTTPASCGSAPAGSVAVPTGGSTLVVNTTAVTANSQIFITEDSSLGSRLGITCNTGTNRNYSVSARTAEVSFTIKSSVNPTINKACLSYWIVN